MNTGAKIKALRKSMGLTQTELGERMGVKKNAVSKWECGRVESIPTSTLKELADLFGVKPSYLMDEDSKCDVFPFEKMKRIPIMGRISAGLPILAEQNIEGYTYTDLNEGAEYFGLRVKGDSMTAARINDGDILIVRQQDIVENGQIAVVMVGDNEATVKRFYQSGDIVTLMPQSTNPIHRPQIYNIKEIKVRVIGLVVKIEITV